jgi:hypothetical protein
MLLRSWKNEYIYAGDLEIDRRQFTLILACRDIDSQDFERECALCSYAWCGDFEAYLEEWKKIATENIENEPYILAYILSYAYNPFPYIFDIIEKVRIELGYKVILLDGSLKHARHYGYSLKKGNGPADFLSLFKNASYVITTSFHGTAFSVIYGKEFVCIDVSDGKGSRQKSLLEKLGLGNRIVQKVSDTEGLPVINEDNVKLRLEEYRKESVEYLKRCAL